MRRVESRLTPCWKIGKLSLDAHLVSSRCLQPRLARREQSGKGHKQFALLNTCRRPLTGTPAILKSDHLLVGYLARMWVFYTQKQYLHSNQVPH
jgi:hypothetical protein